VSSVGSTVCMKCSLLVSKQGSNPCICASLMQRDINRKEASPSRAARLNHLPDQTRCM